MSGDNNTSDEVGLRRRIAEAIAGGPSQAAVDRIEAIVGEYRREIEAQNEARKAIGEALIESGIAVRVGAEAEAIRTGVAAIRSGLEPVVVVVTHSEEGIAVAAASAPVRVVSITPQWYEENLETVTPERLEEMLEGEAVPGDRARVARTIEGLRVEMGAHVAPSGPAP